MGMEGPNLKQEESQAISPEDSPIRQAEEIIDEGRGVLIRHKTLFHGSPILDIEKLIPGENTTVGEGIYFTSESKTAREYAVRRSNAAKGGEPIVYSTKIENLKLFNARNAANIKEVLKDFLDVLTQERQREGLPWFTETSLDEAIKKIKSDQITAGRLLKEVAFSQGRLFTNYLISLGYDGLVTLEGGEGGGEVGEHDTYLIFDPGKILNLSVE